MCMCVCVCMCLCVRELWYCMDLMYSETQWGVGGNLASHLGGVITMNDTWHGTPVCQEECVYVCVSVRVAMGVGWFGLMG